MSRRGPEYLHFKKLQNQGADKGEAESIAWAVGLPPSERPVFVSQDAQARRTALQNGLDTADMFDLMVRLHDLELVEKIEVQSLLGSWDDSPHLACQPSDFTKFDETWARHLNNHRQRKQGR